MSEVGYRRVDITALRELPKHPSADDKRKEILSELFPSLSYLNWKAVLDNDIDLLGRIIRDKLISERATPGKPGRRRTDLSRAEVEPIVDKIRGRDPLERPYALLPFADAFKLLAAGRSVRSLENKTGIPKSWIHNYLTGASIPSLADMEKIATAFKKSPSYFCEYRTQMVVTSVYHYLQSNPEESIRYFEGLSQSKGTT